MTPAHDAVAELLALADGAVHDRSWATLARAATSLASHGPPTIELLARQVGQLLDDDEPELALVLWDDVRAHFAARERPAHHP